MSEEEKDSLTRMLEDLDRVAACDDIGSSCIAAQEWFGATVRTISKGSYVVDVVADIARRLHALMPHDKDGREIKVGDELAVPEDDRDVPRRYEVEELRAVPMMCGCVISADTAEEVRVAEPDSWERLEKDVAKSGACEYFGKGGAPDCEGCRVFEIPGDCNANRAADIVRRAKKLAGVE